MWSRCPAFAAFLTSLISRLTTYQLRTHYLFYHSIKNTFNGGKIYICDSKQRSRLELFVPINTYYSAMDFSKDEMPNSGNLLVHSIWGLDREGLIENFAYGNEEFLKSKGADVKGHGILFRPTILGIELFLWAYGFGQLNIDSFFKDSVTFPNNQSIKIGLTIATNKENKI